MTITYHELVDQGSADWFKLRNGLLTASEMKKIITPTLKVASNEAERRHLYALAAQRLTGYVEDQFQSYAMMRGHEDEEDARQLYRANFEPIEQIGFITNDKFGFTIGCSPDGVTRARDGGIEAKSRNHDLQVQVLVENYPDQIVPSDHILQVQTILLVTEWKWLDYLSFSAGLPMARIRAVPDERIQLAIVEAATQFEIRLAGHMVKLIAMMDSDPHLIATKRRTDGEIHLGTIA